MRPGDRLVRFHAWQGTLAILDLILFLTLMGLATRLSDADGYRMTLGLVSGLGMLAAFAQLGWGIAAAIRPRVSVLRVGVVINWGAVLVWGLTVYLGWNSLSGIAALW